MNMQQIVMQAQKMQRELAKAKKELAQEEFQVSKGGAVTVTMMGDKSIKKISISEDALEKENKEMLEEMLELAIQEILDNIDQADEEVTKSITGSTGGMMGF